MTAIANFRTKILALLDDASLTKYTNDQIDQALREALAKYDRYRPIEKTYIYTGTGDQRITLPADFSALSIHRVEILSDTPTINDSITFYAYKPDEQWMIETKNRVIPTSQTIVVYYAAPNYIDGLDSAAGTSVLAEDEEILALGAAGFAAITRAHSRTEAINLAPQVAQLLQALGQKYLDQFYQHFVAQPKDMVTANWKLDTDKGF